MLYPRESETLEIKDLSGIWNFKVYRRNEGFDKKWHAKSFYKPVTLMPIPASYNDITQDSTIRDHIGDVWYEKTLLL